MKEATTGFFPLNVVRAVSRPVTVETVAFAGFDDEGVEEGAIVKAAVLKEMILVPFNPSGEQPTKSGALALYVAQVSISNWIASVMK